MSSLVKSNGIDASQTVMSKKLSKTSTNGNFEVLML